MNVRKAAQVLSRTVARAIKYYRENEDTKVLFEGTFIHIYNLNDSYLLNQHFSGSETTEKFVELVNDVFDVLNGRCVSQAITRENWERKKEILNEMLLILNQTEDIHKEQLKDKKKKKGIALNDKIPLQMFCSETTLNAWRTDISSAILLVEEMFAAGFEIVLSARWNQDPIEVTFFYCLSVYVLKFFVFFSGSLELSALLTTLLQHILGYNFFAFCHSTTRQNKKLIIVM